MHRGLYHVLGGTLSALSGVGPEDLNVAPLLTRIAEGGVTEVILALGATVDGATTAHWLTDRLRPLGVAVTRVGAGRADRRRAGRAGRRHAGRGTARAPAVVTLSRRDLIHRVGKARRRRGGLSHHGGDGAAGDPRGLRRPAVAAARQGPPDRHHRRRHRRHGAGLGAAQGGLRAAGPGGAHAARRPQLVAARRRRDPRNRQRAARRLGPRRAPVFQSRPGAAAVPPRGHPVLLPRTRRAARGDEQRQPRRAAAERRGVRRQAAAQSAGGQRHPRLRRGTGGQGDGPGRADPGGDHRGQGAHPRPAAQLRRARPGHDLPGLRPRRLQRAARRRHAGGHAQPAARSARDPRCRLLAVPDQFRRELASGSDDDAAGRRHGPHRPGVRPALGGTITYGAEVTALRRTGDGARVVWRDAQDRARARDRGAARGGDHPAAGAARRSRPISRPTSAPRSRRWTTCRRSRSRSRRSGGSGNWTRRSTAASPGPRRDITQVWYPSAGIHQRKGILVGAYIWSDDLGDKFAAMSPAARLDGALADGERLHPGVSPASGQGRVGRLEEHPVQRRGLGGVEPRRAGTALPGAAEAATARSCSPASTCPTSTAGRRARCDPPTWCWKRSAGGSAPDAARLL